MTKSVDASGYGAPPRAWMGVYAECCGVREEAAWRRLDLCPSNGMKKKSIRSRESILKSPHRFFLQCTNAVLRPCVCGCPHLLLVCVARSLMLGPL